MPGSGQVPRHLRAEDIDIENGIMIVTGKGNKQRIVPITTERLLKELTRRVNETGSGYLYISPITGRPYNDIRTAIDNAAKRAGVGKHVYPHLFRHSYGTHAMASGVTSVHSKGRWGTPHPRSRNYTPTSQPTTSEARWGNSADPLKVPDTGDAKKPRKTARP